MWLNYFLNLKWLEEKSGYHPSLSSKWSAAIYINGCTSHILQFTWHKQPSHPLLKSICIDICSQRETERLEELAICHTVGKTKAFSTVFSQPWLGILETWIFPSSYTVWWVKLTWSPSELFEMLLPIVSPPGLSCVYTKMYQQFACCFMIVYVCVLFHFLPNRSKE